MSSCAHEAAGPAAGRFIPQTNGFCLAAVPAIGFVHGAFERPRNVRLVERQGVRRQARIGRGRLSELVDYVAAVFVTMAVAFGPVLAWLIFA